MEGGVGEPLLFLHGIGGLEWDGALERLSASYRVIAPRTPGYGASTGTENLQDVQDLIYFYLDFLDQQNLNRLPIIGHSLGGMIAAELAAVQPDRFTKLVLISPLGLWDRDHQVLDFFVASPSELAGAMYFDQDSSPARAIASSPQQRTIEVDPDSEEGRAIIDYFVERAKSMATVAKYLWPIPNKGLNKRLHRVSMPTLLVWGERDGICPTPYGADFKAAIADSRLRIVPEAAHMVAEEQPERVAALITDFLANG